MILELFLSAERFIPAGFAGVTSGGVE